MSASRKQKYDRDFSEPDISSFSTYDSLPAADLTSKIDFDTNSIDSLSIQSDLIEKYLPNTSAAMTTGHIKRYKMERKNSQQSQHGKQESSIFSGVESIRTNIQLECDPNLLELIGDTDIRVKIADLGNACYNVGHRYIQLISISSNRSINCVNLFALIQLGPSFHWRYSNTPISIDRSVAGLRVQLHGWYLEHRMLGIWIVHGWLFVRSQRLWWVFTRWRPPRPHHWIAGQHSATHYLSGQTWSEIFY